MSQSFADELTKIKLKPSKDKTKDFSDPKLAGFLSQNQISNYQENVLKSNIEQWQNLLDNETFPTCYFPLTQIDAQYFIRIFEKYFQKLYDSQSYDEIKSKIQNDFHGDSEENQWFEQLRIKLQNFIDDHYQNDQGFFVKTSSRSAKDAVIFRENFIEIYKNQLKTMNQIDDENSRIKCLLNAAFLSQRLHSGVDVLKMFVVSERIYQDMLLIIETHRSSNKILHEHFVFRPFIFIDVDMEFRGFVFKRNLTCLSQYNYLIHSPRLLTLKEKILQKIVKFFNETIKYKLNNSQLDNYIIDFALTKTTENNDEIDSMKVWVIEINPFLETTDGALFSWSHERYLIEQNPYKETLFRLTERSRPGSWTMLPSSIRNLIKIN